MDAIINIVEREPLTTSQIEALSPYSDRYLVPFQCTKSRPCGIILYTTVDRKGADEEASKIADSLEQSGCDVFKLQWSSTSELRLQLMVYGELSALVVVCCIYV